MSDKNIAEQVRNEIRAQLEEALGRTDIQPKSIEWFEKIVEAGSDEEREAAIAEAVAAGESEDVIRAASLEVVDRWVDEDAEEEDADEDDDEPVQYAEVPTQGSVTLNLLMTIQEPGTLAHAFDSFNASLGRFGTDSFYVVARDEAGNEWVVSNGNIMNTEDEDEDDEE